MNISDLVNCGPYIQTDENLSLNIDRMKSIKTEWDFENPNNSILRLKPLKNNFQFILRHDGKLINEFFTSYEELQYLIEKYNCEEIFAKATVYCDGGYGS